MGVMLARLGRYCDCFEEVEEYDIEVSKVSRIRRIRERNNNVQGQSQYDPKMSEKEASIEELSKPKPFKAPAKSKNSNQRNVMLDSSQGNILDLSSDYNNEGLMGIPRGDSRKPNKEALLKHKLQRIRERRKNREKQEDEMIGTKKDRAHILNVTNNKEFFMDKDQVQEFDSVHKFQ